MFSFMFFSVRTKLLKEVEMWKLTQICFVDVERAISVRE